MAESDGVPEQLTLLRETVRRSRTKEPVGLATHRPVARVAVDVSLSHLDRPFDYLVPADLDEAAQPGCRVKVRFAGKDADGFLLARLHESDHGGRLTRIRRVVSPEPVLTPEIAELCRAVADRYAGVFADVTRLAVPPRHAKVEAEPTPDAPEGTEGRQEVGGSPPEGTEGRQGLEEAADRRDEVGEWRAYGHADSFVAALGRGEPARAVWSALPGADWARAYAELAALTAAAGRGALLLAPDARDLARLAEACRETVGEDGFVSLSADLGPTARYRAFLAALRGQVRVVIGTRAAAFAPVTDLGLVAIWDDGDDSYAEARAPYPHAREVLLLRAHRQQTAALLGGFARSTEAAALLETGWAAELVADRAAIRRAAPAVHVTGESDTDLARDAAARAARLPHQAFEATRDGLRTGPVLVQVPRAGYVPSLVCQTCRSPARCVACGGGLRRTSATEPPGCPVCGRPAPEHRCPECGDSRVRAAVVGARRTAEELGRAFPGIAVRTSGGDNVLDVVPDKPALVVATPGAEPHGNYSAALLLDGWLLLARPDLRAAEEAVRRWFNAAALVRSDGTVILVGPPGTAPVQALVRWSPGGFAARELGERRTAGFPPAARVAAVTGPAEPVADVLSRISLPATVLGPVPIDDGSVRAVLTVPRPTGQELARQLHAAQAARSAKKLPGPIRIQIDPPVL